MEGEEPCVSFLFSHFDSFFSSDKLSLGKGVQEGQRVKVFFFLSNFQLLPPPCQFSPSTLKEEGEEWLRWVLVVV
jgi:hypothetical protein